jgi:hypothetical protein
MFGGLAYVNNSSIQADIRDNRLLGGSAKIGLNSLTDLKQFHPTLAPKTTIYFKDADLPLYREHSWGDLLKMAYGNDEITALYASLGEAMPQTLADNFLVIGIRDDRLVDETPAPEGGPIQFSRYIPSEIYALVLSASEVAPGETYTLTVLGAKDRLVRIAYTLNGGPVETFTATLDGRGHATFNVSPDTRKGTYQFIGFSIAGGQWIQAGETITVR